MTEAPQPDGPEMGHRPPPRELCISAAVATRAPASGEARLLAEVFGLSGQLRQQLYDDLRVTLQAGEILAVVGPSGGGKTLLLGELDRRLATRDGTDVIWLRPERLACSAKPAVETLTGGPLDQRLQVLSRCGLADAAALVTPARYLSGGQLHRLALAEALHRASRAPGAVVLADEVASTLDFDTASTLSLRVRSLVTDSNVSLVLATPRMELLGFLQPDRVVVKPLRREGSLRPPPARRRPTEWRIRQGSIADYDELSCFHYLAGRPAAHKRVYVIRPPRPAPRSGVELTRPGVAAVAVVSPPVLQCRGRNVHTAGRYAGRPRRPAVAKLNAEIECISRVVVHPIWRGLGLAVRLVRHAIRTARTPYVEALAAMGAVHPFFRKAGMTDAGSFPGRSRPYHYYFAATPLAGAPLPQEQEQ